MSLALFHEVPAKAIEIFFDEQKQPLFKSTALGKCLGIEEMRDNFKYFSTHYAHARSEVVGTALPDALERAKILMISSLIWMVL